jgi:hypothetical protein
VAINNQREKKEFNEDPKMWDEAKGGTMGPNHAIWEDLLT